VFWQTLLNDSPDIHKLIKIGKQIIVNNKDCASSFESLTQIYSQMPICFEIYGFYQKLVMNNQKDSEKNLNTYAS